MLRNRGVNATERRIRQDVLRAYEQEIFDARPRRRCLDDAGCRGPGTSYPQPRYCTARCTRPVYFHTASSATSYGVKRVYIPDEGWGTESAESTVYVRHPRYNMRSYYPNGAYHLSGERPYKSDLRYEGYYSRRPSSMYIDDNDCCPNWSSRHSRQTDRKLVKKVTRKLSPIFTCECAAASNVRHLKNNKVHHNNLSKEAKELSLDVFKILSLLQKADGEDDEPFSSVSLLQNIHNLDCRSSNSVAKVITQRVNVCQKMERPKQDDPLTKFKAVSGVRSKLEALVDALRQYEAEKFLSRANSSNYDTEPQYKNIIPSDPPSLEVRSFSNGKDLKSSTNINGGKQKDFVIQTEQPKMSNKSVYGKGKLKKGDSGAERKSLKSRLSWRKKENSGIKMRRDNGNERLTDKFFSKTKSKSRISSIIESEQSQLEKSIAGKQGQATNKAGLMIKIGGNPQPKKSVSPEKDKKTHKEKLPKTWIRKFIEDKKETKNNIRIRWNNKAFYTRSSSTIFELVNNVYKQMGISNSKSDDISTSKLKKIPKRTTHKHSKTRMQTSPKKPKGKQKLEAYMMHQIIVPGPVYTPIVTNKDIESYIPKPQEKLHDFTPNFYSGLNTTSALGINYFEIKLPKNFFHTGSMSEESTKDKRVYKYEAMKSKDTLLDYFDGIGVDRECTLNESISLDASEDVYSEDVIQISNSLCFSKSDGGELNVTGKEPESEPNNSIIQKCIYEETEPKYLRTSRCSLAQKILEDEFLNWMPMSSDSLLLPTNCEELDKVSIIYDDISIKSDVDNAAESINEYYTQNTNTVISKDSREVNGGMKFSGFNDYFVQWRNRATGTFSDSIVGVNARKPVVMTVFWNLIKLLKRSHSSKSKIKPPPQDLSLVQPPGTVSQPECSHNSENLYVTRKPLRSQQRQLPFEPLRLAQLASAALQNKKEVALVIPALVRKCSIQFDDLVEDVSPVETTEESGKALMHKEQSQPINSESVQARVLDEIKVEQETFSTHLKPLSLIRLVRSVHTELQTEKNIKPNAIRSVQLLQHQTHQLKSQLLLFLLPVFNGHMGKNKKVLDQCQPSVEPQPPKPTECLSVSSRCDLQGMQSASADINKALKEAINNNLHDITISENNFDVLVQKLTKDKPNPVNVDNCDKRQIRDTSANKTKKNKQLTYATQMDKIENNICPSVVEVTKGDEVTKIFIRKRKTNKENNLKSANLRISQDPVVTDNAVPIKQSIKRISKKNVKVCINITNIKVEDSENGKNVLNKTGFNHVFKDQSPKKKVDECQVTAREYINLNYTIDGAADSQRCSIYKSYSAQELTECPQVDDMSGTNTQRNHVTKPPSERRISVTEFNDPFIANEKSSIDSQLYDIAAEDYVNEIFGTTDRIDPMKLKKVVEMRRTLNAMMTLNVNSFAEMALMHELASEHNDTYTSVRQQLKRRKNIMSILSEINMRYLRTDYLRQQAKTTNAEYFHDSGSSRTSSLYNILARKMNSHRCVEVDKQTKFKGDIAANYYIPHSVSPVMPRSLEFGDLLSRLKEEHSFNNSDTFININNTGIGAMLMDSMLTGQRNNEEIMHENEPICWCAQNFNKKPRKHIKTWKVKKHTNGVSKSCQNDTVIDDDDSYNSQRASFTEYKVRFTNEDPMSMIDDSLEKSDILQSCKMKKAVLQIYSDETVEDGGYLVAKLPRYLRL